MTQLTTIGQNIKSLRQYRGLSQKELAELCRMDQARITNIENGKSNFEINTLVRIASALNCTIDIILKPI